MIVCFRCLLFLSSRMMIERWRPRHASVLQHCLRLTCIIITHPFLIITCMALLLSTKPANEIHKYSLQRFFVSKRQQGNQEIRISGFSLVNFLRTGIGWRQRSLDCDHSSTKWYQRWVAICYKSVLSSFNLILIYKTPRIVSYSQIL